MSRWREKTFKLGEIIDGVPVEIIRESILSYGDVGTSLLESIYDILIRWLDNEGYEAYYIDYRNNLIYTQRKGSNRVFRFKIEFSLDKIMKSILDTEIKIIKMKGKGW